MYLGWDFVTNFETEICVFCMAQAFLVAFEQSSTYQSFRSHIKYRQMNSRRHTSSPTVVVLSGTMQVLPRTRIRKSKLVLDESLLLLHTQLRLALARSCISDHALYLQCLRKHIRGL